MRFFFSLVFLFLMFNLSSAQDYFDVINEANVPAELKERRSIVPKKYKVSLLEIEKLKQYLISDKERNIQSKQISILDPNGKSETFLVSEVKMMEDGLAAKFPAIKTFTGQGVKSRGKKIHLGLSTTGFYASVSTPNGSYAIDRFADKDDRYYISYFLKDHIEEGNFSCGTTDSNSGNKESESYTRNPSANLPLRTYRFALACTGEFGAFYGPAKEDVLGEMMKSVNRINLVLENDFAIRLILISDNDKLIWTDADSDPYPDGNTGGTLLGQNTGILSTNVGFGNFDIGHVYTRGCDDTGGIAFLESACSGNKGGGVTCHYSNDITAMAIRVAAHEVGHQLGANHTFNNCSGNENSGTAYEPGSGSTIMSYGGLCGPDLNVINVADDYYHINSIIEVTTFTRSLFGNTCASLVETSNNIPAVEIPIESGFSIPIGTPFELTGEAEDLDGDLLTYSWEQFNLGPTSNPGSPMGNSPLFISQYPDTSKSRVFPRMATIVANIEDKREVLPLYERDLNFQFVVRDNNPESGAVAWEEIEFYSSESAGPFLINFPNNRDTFNAGEEIELLWDVANTDNDIVNCQSVDIFLSTDGGYTYGELIIGQTPNDGNELIFVPNTIGDSARIKIKAAENIFFDISNEDFVIEAPEKPGFIFKYNPSFVRNCVPNDFQIEFSTEALLDYSEPIQMEVVNGLVEGMNVTFSDESILPGEKTTATISFSDLSLNGEVVLEVEARSATDTLRREIVLQLTSSDFSDIVPMSPAPGNSGTVVAPMFHWTPDTDATSYVFKLSDNPSFAPELSQILYRETLTDTFFELDDILEKSTVYYWTVTGKNECGEGEFSEIYTFGTEALSCNTYEYNDVPLGISQSGVITIDMPLEILGEGQVTDVNVQKIRGTHSWVSELKGELISPAGTSVLLFNKKCGNQSNFNAGFDDDAVNEITCPLNQGIFYQPEEKLDTFLGTDLAGTWLFKLTDTQIGNGGTVQEYKLELCSNEVLEGPQIVHNNAFPVPPGVGRRLSSDFLLVEDGNNISEELVFTLVKMPANGTIRKEDTILDVGSRFTQKDIDLMQIRYQHNGDSDEDQFTFTVEDGEGGWIDLTTFNIVIDDNIVLDIEELQVPDYQLFPNPGNGIFNIVFNNYVDEISIIVYNGLGQKIVLKSEINAISNAIVIPNAISGVYFVEIIGKDFRDVRKVVVE